MKKIVPPKYVCVDGPMDGVVVNMGRNKRFGDVPVDAFRIVGVHGAYVFGAVDSEGEIPAGSYFWNPQAQATELGELVVRRG